MFELLFWSSQWKISCFMHFCMLQKRWSTRWGGIFGVLKDQLTHFWGLGCSCIIPRPVSLGRAWVRPCALWCWWPWGARSPSSTLTWWRGCSSGLGSLAAAYSCILKTLATHSIGMRRGTGLQTNEGERHWGTAAPHLPAARSSRVSYLHNSDVTTLLCFLSPFPPHPSWKRPRSLVLRGEDQSESGGPPWRAAPLWGVWAPKIKRRLAIGGCPCPAPKSLVLS